MITMKPLAAWEGGRGGEGRERGRRKKRRRRRRRRKRNDIGRGEGRREGRKRREEGERVSLDWEEGRRERGGMRRGGWEGRVGGEGGHCPTRWLPTTGADPASCLPPPPLALRGSGEWQCTCQP